MSSSVLGVAVLGKTVLGSTSTGAINVIASSTLALLDAVGIYNANQAATESLAFTGTTTENIGSSSSNAFVLSFSQTATVEVSGAFAGYGTLGRADTQLGKSFLLGKPAPPAARFSFALETLLFTESNTSSLDSLAFGVLSELVLTEMAECNLKEVLTDQTWVISEDASPDGYKPLGHTLTLTESAAVQKVVTAFATDEMLLSQSPAVATVQDQIRYYAPDTSRTEFQRPILVKRQGVILDYAGLQLELRSPEPDNKFRSVANRVNRESLGGDQIVYRDPQWINRRTLVFDIINIHVDKLESVLDFMSASLGREITFTDWESRVWRGVILNPDEFIVNNTRDHFDISIELETQTL